MTASPAASLADTPLARSGQRPYATLPAATVAGFTASVASWVVWWLTHLPGVAMPAKFAAPLLALTLVVALAAASRRAARPIQTAALGGFLAGFLNLLILGSVLGVQAESADAMQSAANRFRSEAPSIVGGYLLITALTGLIGGGIAASFPGRTGPACTTADWLGRFAILVVLSFFPLLVIGGAVTGTESGMAVPDAVTSYGAFSAMLPMSMMAEPRIFLEHTHRLFGTLVGLNAIALVVFAVRAERRALPKLFAAILLLLVIIQGTFGAIRVGAVSSGLAAVHGIFAQLVLAFAVVVACKLSTLDSARDGIDERTRLAAAKGVRVTHFAAVALLIQLTLGALGRHLPNGVHAIWTHAAFAFVVVLLVVMGAATMRSATPAHPAGRLLRTVGGALLLLTGLQFLLGFASFLLVGVGEAPPIPNADQLAEARQIDPAEAIVTTAHQTIGAGLLALITLGVYWTKRISRAGTGPQPTPSASTAVAG